MWRHLSQLAVVVVAVLILTSCSGAEDQVAPPKPLEAADLLEGGHSVEVAECVTGLADGLSDGGPTDELIAACERAEAMLNAPEEVPEEIAFVGPVTYGDDAELDALWDRCGAGEGAACDALWEMAPVGSDYERFGVTCGERDEVLNCADLDRASGDQTTD